MGFVWNTFLDFYVMAWNLRIEKGFEFQEQNLIDHDEFLQFTRFFFLQHSGQVQILVDIEPVSFFKRLFVLQPTQLCTQIKIMKALEDDTDYKLKTVKEAEINLVDFDDEASLRQNLKDRQHGNDYINEVEESRKRLEQVRSLTQA